MILANRYHVFIGENPKYAAWDIFLAANRLAQAADAADPVMLAACVRCGTSRAVCYACGYPVAGTVDTSAARLEAAEALLREWVEAHKESLAKPTDFDGFVSRTLLAASSRAFLAPVGGKPCKATR